MVKPHEFCGFLPREALFLHFPALLPHAESGWFASLLCYRLDLRKLGEKFLAADLSKKLVEVLVILKIEGDGLLGAFGGELDLSA